MLAVDGCYPGKANTSTEVAETLSHLKLTTKSSKTQAKPKSAPVADSWDADLSSGSDTETEASNTINISRTSTTSTSSSSNNTLSPIRTLESADPPNPPPPTPASPTRFEYPDNVPVPFAREAPREEGRGTRNPDKRPEKTTAVAGRLIAGALGVRAPRRTEEEREYDRAMRDKERRRRDEERAREKAEKEAAEARKKAIWDD
jgi:hypothetical protein